MHFSLALIPKTRSTTYAKINFHLENWFLIEAEITPTRVLFGCIYFDYHCREFDLLGPVSDISDRMT
jgi:hypothetical protein